MAIPPISQEKIDEIRAVYAQTRNITHTADITGAHKDSVRKYIRNMTVPSADPISGSVRVLYFTDPHDRIDLDKTRFEWLGKLARDERPDVIVCGGDVFDVDSLNKHTKNETYEGKLKPAFRSELESLSLAFRAIDKFCPPRIPRHITLGNHEQRVWRFENDNPECYGIMTSAFLDLLGLHRWQVTKFKDYLNLGGVEFTHAPISAMGREVGGKGSTLRIATDSLRSLVYGHTHKREDAAAAKLGPDNRHVRAYNGGCFMPDGYRMDYAKASQNRWDYGCSILTISGECLDGVEWISMRTLGERYA